jgi:hypothetical protein
MKRSRNLEPQGEVMKFFLGGSHGQAEEKMNLKLEKELSRLRDSSKK